MSQDEKDIEILKLLYSEWDVRMVRLWSIIQKVAIMIVVLIVFPLVSEHFSISPKSILIPLELFPVLGLILALVESLLTFTEMKRCVEIKKCIKENSRRLSPSFALAYKEKGNGFNAWVPVFVCLIQAVIAIIVIQYV